MRRRPRFRPSRVAKRPGRVGTVQTCAAFANAAEWRILPMVIHPQNVLKSPETALNNIRTKYSVIPE